MKHLDVEEQNRFISIFNGSDYNKYDFKDIVRMESFKQVQRLKFILLAYKKILPHILDQSFICNDR